MIDRIVAPALTFLTLIVATLVLAAAMFGLDTRRAAPVRVVQLEPVVVTAKRLAPASTVADNGITESAAPRVQ